MTKSEIPHINDIENIKENEIEKIKDWINHKSETAYNIFNEENLPDMLNYGESITIIGIDDSKFTLNIDEIIYEYKDILNVLDEFISQQNCIVEDEKQVVEIIKSVLPSD